MAMQIDFVGPDDVIPPPDTTTTTETLARGNAAVGPGELHELAVELPVRVELAALFVEGLRFPADDFSDAPDLAAEVVVERLVADAFELPGDAPRHAREQRHEQYEEEEEDFTEEDEF